MWGSVADLVESLGAEAAQWVLCADSVFELCPQGRLARRVEEARCALADVDVMSILATPLCAHEDEWQLHLYIGTILFLLGRFSAAATLFSRAYVRGDVERVAALKQIAVVCDEHAELMAESSTDDGSKAVVSTLPATSPSVAVLEAVLQIKHKEGTDAIAFLQQKAFRVAEEFRLSRNGDDGGGASSAKKARTLDKEVPPEPSSTPQQDFAIACFLYSTMINAYGNSYLLQKGLFLADIAWVHLYGHRLVSEVPLAYEQGPVYYKVYQTERDSWRRSRLTFRESQSMMPALPTLVQQVLAVIAKFVIKLGSRDVVNLIHTQAVWRNADNRAPMPDDAIISAYTHPALFGEHPWLAELLCVVRKSISSSN
jgi:uncharacterized phage-associated protein